MAQEALVEAVVVEAVEVVVGVEVVVEADGVHHPMGL